MGVNCEDGEEGAYAYVGLGRRVAWCEDREVGIRECWDGQVIREQRKCVAFVGLWVFWQATKTL